MYVINSSQDAEAGDELGRGERRSLGSYGEYSPPASIGHRFIASSWYPLTPRAIRYDIKLICNSRIVLHVSGWHQPLNYRRNFILRSMSGHVGSATSGRRSDGVHWGTSLRNWGPEDLRTWGPEEGLSPCRRIQQNHSYGSLAIGCSLNIFGKWSSRLRRITYTAVNGFTSNLDKWKENMRDRQRDENKKNSIAEKFSLMNTFARRSLLRSADKKML